MRGLWESDSTWSYDSILSIEVSEIGATMIALSVPGVKPLFDRFILRKDPSAGSNGQTKYGNGKQSSTSRGIALRSLNLRPEHNMLTSGTLGKGNFQSANQSRDNQSENSAQGILVNVDFQIKEDNSGRRHYV